MRENYAETLENYLIPAEEGLFTPGMMKSAGKITKTMFGSVKLSEKISEMNPNDVASKLVNNLGDSIVEDLKSSSAIKELIREWKANTEENESARGLAKYIHAEVKNIDGKNIGLISARVDNKEIFLFMLYFSRKGYPIAYKKENRFIKANYISSVQAEKILDI